MHVLPQTQSAVAAAGCTALLMQVPGYVPQGVVRTMVEEISQEDVALEPLSTVVTRAEAVVGPGFDAAAEARRLVQWAGCPASPSRGSSSSRTRSVPNL